MDDSLYIGVVSEYLFYGRLIVAIYLIEYGACARDGLDTIEDVDVGVREVV